MSISSLQLTNIVWLKNTRVNRRVEFIRYAYQKPRYENLVESGIHFIMVLKVTL